MVADEVRTLAQRTQESTQEIRDIIERLQRQAAEAASSMKQSHDQVTISLEKSQQADATLETIFKGIATINDMNGEVANASAEQSRAASDMQGNTASIRERSESVQEIAGDVRGSVAGIERDMGVLTTRLSVLKVAG